MQKDGVLGSPDFNQLLHAAQWPFQLPKKPAVKYVAYYDLGGYQGLKIESLISINELN